MTEAMPKDAIAMLKADHRKVDALFKEYEEATAAGAKAKLAAKICDELKIHTTIEEEIFYPALKGKIDKDLYEEAHVEHDSAKVLVNDIAAGKPSAAFYDAKVMVLSEQIKHHVREEERLLTGMFAQARRADVDLVRLRNKMLARKNELLATAKRPGLPPATPRVVELSPA